MKILFAVAVSSLMITSAYASSAQDEITAIQKAGGVASAYHLVGKTPDAAQEDCFVELSLDATSKVGPVTVGVGKEKTNAQKQLISDGTVDLQFGNDSQTDTMENDSNGLTLTTKVHFDGKSDVPFFPTVSFTSIYTLNIKSEAGQITEVRAINGSHEWWAANKGDITCSGLKAR